MNVKTEHNAMFTHFAKIRLDLLTAFALKIIREKAIIAKVTLLPRRFIVQTSLPDKAVSRVVRDVFLVFGIVFPQWSRNRYPKQPKKGFRAGVSRRGWTLFTH
jgi:hypothetical protein